MEARAVVIKKEFGGSSLCMSAALLFLHRLFDGLILSIRIELQDHVSIPRLRRCMLKFLTPVKSDSQPFVVLRVGPHTAAIRS